MIHYIENERILSEVLNNDKLVIVDFFATWCEPCKLLAPVLKKACEKYEDKVEVFKVDVDETQSIAMRYHISAMPTLIFFKNGEEVERQVGCLGEEKLERIINDLI
ncbi:MAG: thioredoxin [Clostridia bacterium]|nr:thioredoxin [Clostridia bacterium]